jgi:hypothetical protein
VGHSFIDFTIGSWFCVLCDPLQFSTQTM